MSGLTKKCQYALRALFFLAREFGRGPVVVRQISAETRVPPEFLQIILLELKNAGVLGSHRGSRGGYCLLISPDELTVGAIVRLMDSPSLAPQCSAESEAGRCSDCDAPGFCPTKALMRDLNDAIASVLNSTTLSQCCVPKTHPPRFEAAVGAALQPCSPYRP